MEVECDFDYVAPREGILLTFTQLTLLTFTQLEQGQGGLAARDKGSVCRHGGQK